MAPQPRPLRSAPMTRTATVTGGTPGVDRASGRRRLSDVARRAARLRTLRAELGAAVAHAVDLDVRDRDAVAHAFAALPTPFHEPDLLLNNAGLALGIGRAQEADLGDWDVMVDTNV